MAVQYHLQIDDGDIAPYVLLSGDPGRVATIASLWDDARHVATNREYVTYSGTYGGVPITCTSTGIGAPSTAIAMEELARCGATTFIRVGTCGTFLDHGRNGDMAIFDSAVRLDGASHGHAPPEFPAVASHEVVAAAVRAAEQIGVDRSRSARPDPPTRSTPDTHGPVRRSPGSGNRGGMDTSRICSA